MDLNKTINNIRNSKTRFFNIPLGKTVYSEVLRKGIHFNDKSYKYFTKFIIYDKEQICSNNITNELYFKKGLKYGNLFLGYIGKIYFTE